MQYFYIDLDTGAAWLCVIILVSGSDWTLHNMEKQTMTELMNITAMDRWDEAAVTIRPYIGK